MRTGQGAPRASALAAAVALGVLVGCGGDEGPTRGEWLREANAVCKRHNDRITRAASEVLAGGNVPDRRAFGRLARETILPEYAAQIRELRAVEAPADQAADYDAWLDESQALHAMLERNPVIIQQPRALAAVNRGANRLALSDECRIGPG